jgi:3-hydroxyisobutyrate dehydrogenase
MSSQMPQTKDRVGLLGVGLMGSAMAHRLLDQGIAVTAWDRNAEHVRDLEGRGGEPAETPGDVIHGAGIVIHNAAHRRGHPRSGRAATQRLA